jgi:hypothetical protein
MNELHQRAIAQDMHDHPEDWCPHQPRVQVGVKRHYPRGVRVAFAALSFVSGVAAAVLLVIYCAGGCQ